MIEKKYVEKNFSKGSKNYDECAVVQRYMADKLIEILIKDGKRYKEILEIGCGTGEFSKKAVSIFNSSSFDLIDISEEMVEKAKEKLDNYKNINYICCDGEKYKSDKKYDLIISNAVFQWFNNIKESIEHYFTILNDGGTVVFSIFGDGTYKELKDSILSAGIKYQYIQDFITFNELENISISLTGNFSITEEIYIEKYSNLRDFLRYIKNIGANSANEDKPVLTPKKIQKIEEIYNERFSDKDKIKVTNVLFFCIIKKEI